MATDAATVADIIHHSILLPVDAKTKMVVEDDGDGAAFKVRMNNEWYDVTIRPGLAPD